MNKRIIIISIIVAALVSGGIGYLLALREQPSPERRIGVVWLTLEHPFYQAFSRSYKMLAEEQNFKLFGMDGKFDPSVMADAIEDLITLDVDGILFCPIDAASAVPSIKEAQEAGIPIVTAYIKHGEGAHCPFVGFSEYEKSRRGGVAAAEFFKELHPDWVPIFGFLAQEEVTACVNRCKGFLDGFNSVIQVPGTDEYLASDVGCNVPPYIFQVEGGGLREPAYIATEDLITAHPEINLFFAINDDSGLGGLAALKAAGRGTPETGFIAFEGGTGSEEAILTLADPNVSVEFVIGFNTYKMAKDCQMILNKTILGEIPMVGDYDYLHIPVKNLTSRTDLDVLQEFLYEETGSEIDIREYLGLE